jgi:hypothetical protein
LVFAIVVVALIKQSYAVLGITLLLSIALGFITELYDNKRDENHKHNNVHHAYKH